MPIYDTGKTKTWISYVPIYNKGTATEHRGTVMDIKVSVAGNEIFLRDVSRSCALEICQLLSEKQKDTTWVPVIVNQME